MKKSLLLLLLFISTYSSGQNLWKQENENRITTIAKMDRKNVPTVYNLYSLDLNAFKVALQNAPLDTSKQKTNTILSFPISEGNFDDFTIYKAPVMEVGLSLKYAGIESYTGISVSNPATTIRFSITVFGLHAIIFSPSGTSYIDAYTKDLNNYIVYNRKDIASNSTFNCDFVNDEPLKNGPSELPTINSNRSSAGNFKIYRLAMACTIEYAAFHVNAAGLNAGTIEQKKAAVLSAMVITMTRVNAIFEKDMALRMTLIANNDLIIFITTDNFSNNNSSLLINESQTEINAAIGAANYDIGHTVSTGGGGLAQLFSPCSGNKARGITGQGSPVGDPFDIDYVAHEMGHQWGGNHTQNNNCNRAAAACVEPGSASTIMGYAGICSPNVQTNSDAYFHTISITEMQNFIAGAGGTCGSSTINTNATPVANAGLDYTIPFGTPYLLKGTATDANSGDVLTYCWEQINNQVSTQPPTQTATTGPNFRSLSPSLSSNRYMPILSSVIAGNLAPTWEVISNVARTMNFALTVRDNSILNGAQTSRDDMVLTVANVGPFIVTSPNTNVSYEAGTNQTITWNVAGTTANGINCANIDIYLSTNGGTSFPILLASNVPNDGSEIVSIPNVVGTSNRIMISGNKHIFYDVSNTNFSIISPVSGFSLAFSGIENGQNKEVCQGTNTTYDLNYAALLGFSGTTTFSIIGNPAGTVVSFSPSSINGNGVVLVTISNTQAALPGLYEMTVTGTSGGATKVVKLYLTILNSTFSTILPTSPSNNAFVQATNINLNWTADSAATQYVVQVALDQDFTTIISNQTVTTNSFTISGLIALTNYFWRVQPRNTGCFGSFNLPYRFTTTQNPCTDFASTNVPVTISATGTPTVTSTLTIPTINNVSIADINVTVNISHTYTSDLTVTLISPNNTQVNLVVNQCGSNNNITATFDDAGTTLVCGTTPAISGTITPTQLLSTFNGQNSQGLWTLRVVDNANADGGTINSWSLNICSPPIPFSCGQISTTWNGTSWSNGKPQDNVATTINGNFTTTENLNACSLDIIGTSQVLFSSGNNVTVGGIVNVGSNASLTIQNNANLIQIQNVANTANAKVYRDSNPLMRLDYTIWSSPVTGTQTLKQFSPLTLNNRFYNYNTTSNLYSAVLDPITQTFGLSNGYLIRMPDNHPTTPTIWNGMFNGNLNNGTITSSLSYSGAGQSFNMIGNPYPSTINADSFLFDNTANITGTIYFWRKINNAAGTAYATYTLGGATTTSPTSPTPNGIIQVGQGFIVEAKNFTTPTATFLNSHRIGNNQNQFFRNSTDVEKNRIWLNLTNSSGLFSQTMIGYMTNATNGFDELLDGKYINDNATSLTSLLDNEEYAIQLKGLPFNDLDTVPLLFKTSNAGNFTVSIDHVDGLFETENQSVYLKDSLLQNIHNLSASTYNFTTNEGVFPNRFEIVFREQSLDNSDFNANSVVLYSQNNQIFINSGSVEMLKIDIFDILGRKINSFENINAATWTTSIIPIKNQTLLVKITLSNGVIVTKKIMH